MKPTGIVLLVLGVLAAIAGFIAPVIGTNVAVGKVNSTDSTTYGEGTLVKLLNTGKLVATPSDPYDTNVPVKSTRVTTANKEAMAADDAKSAGATIFDTTSVTTRADNGQELSTSKAVFAFTPSDSQLINCCGASLGGVTDVDFQGVMPLKFPFGTPQSDIEVFDTTLQKPVTTTFAGTVEQFDMTLYKFTQSIPATETPAAPTKVPAALAKGVVGQLAPQLADKVPADGELAMYEFYSAENEFLVEPLTGQIVDGTLKSKTTFRLQGGDQDIVTKVEAEAGSSNVEEGAKEIKASADLLGMVAMALPLMLGLGALLAIIGIVLIVLGGKKKKNAAAAAPASGAGSSS